MEALSKEEIVHGNKLIAEFLGYEYIPHDPENSLRPGWWRKDTPARILNYPSATKLAGYFLCRRHADLRYYNSWDALIPVMEKLNNMYEKQEISRKSKTFMYARMAGEAMLRFDRNTCFIYVILMIKELNEE
jgi:hypothetical protein